MQSDESQLLVEILITVAREAPVKLFMLLAEQRRSRFVVYLSMNRYAGVTGPRLEVVGPPSKFLIQTFEHLPSIQPFHVSACLDTPLRSCAKYSSAMDERLYTAARFWQNNADQRHQSPLNAM
jgi:hypothetical protein